MPAPQKTVAIIGAGLSGMACALILAKHGYKIVLIERSAKPGATLRGFSRGVHFDTGLHYTGGLHEGGALRRYLRYLGVGHVQTVPFDAACFDEIRFADSGLTVRLPVGYERMTEALCASFPDDHDAVVDYMRAARAVFDAAPFVNGELTLSAPSGSAASAYAAESLDAFLRKRTNNAHLRATLAAHTLLHGVAPGRVAFAQHAYIAASYFDSVHTLAGGGKALVAALEEQLAACNVELVCGKPVCAIRFGAGRRVSGLELADGTEYTVDEVVYTAHPAVLPDLVPTEVFKPAFSTRLKNLTDTVSAYMLFGIAQAKPACLNGRNLILHRDAQLADAFAPDHDPAAGPFYVTACPEQPGRANTAAACGVIVMAPGHFNQVEAWADSTPTTRPQAYKDYKTATLARMRTALIELCPELASLRFVDGATPLSLRDQLHTPRGGLYGCEHSLDQFNPLPVTHAPNLWLAGQAVVAPGVLGAMVSAFMTCGFLVGHEHLQKEVLQCN